MTTTYTEQDLREALTSLADADPGPVDMWTPTYARIVRRRYIRVGGVATVAAAAVAIAVLAWPGGRTPDAVQMGDDGTTVVTLTAARQLSTGELSRTVDVLRQRLDALGVTGEIRTNGDVITLSVAAADADMVSSLGARGEVQWRQVLEVKPADGSPAVGGSSAVDLSSAETEFRQQDCAGSAGGPDGAGSAAAPAGSYLIACNAAADIKYLLAPSSIANADIASAESQQDSVTGSWLVTVAFTHPGSQAWQQLTAHASQQPQMLSGQCQPPGGCNGIGIVVDGQILVVPSVESGPGGITGGETQITGPASQDAARVFAAEIAAPPLPAAMTATTSSVPAAEPTPCDSSFALSLVSDRNGQPTPEQAANWFAVHGDVGHVPATGWHVTSNSDGTATLQSGTSTLRAVQGPDRTWQVDSGHNCA